MLDKDIYEQNGYVNRQEYLNSLADDYGVSLSTVQYFACMLGPTEDFDDLINELEDFCGLKV